MSRSMNAAQPQKRPRRRLWRRSESRTDLEAVFLEHLPLIERVATSACRRAGLPPQDAEDFASQVKLKLIDDDYATLRKHRGDSRLTTYLTTVVHNQFKDWCNHKWGKFRPSAAAKRQGPDAKALERLLVLDRLDLETAIEMLKTNHRVATPRDELRRIATELPRRTQRSFVGEEALAERPSAAPEADAERRVADGERSAVAARVESMLNLALESLSAQDLLILKMHFRDGCTVAAIAAALGLEQRPLYSRKDRCLATLKATFEAQDLAWDQVREVLGWQQAEIRADFRQAADENEDADKEDTHQAANNGDASV